MHALSVHCSLLLEWFMLFHVSSHVAFDAVFCCGLVDSHQIILDMSSHSWMIHERGSIQHGILQRSRYQNEMPVSPRSSIIDRRKQHNIIIYPNTINITIHIHINT
jgi:hypothetical protein